MNISVCLNLNARLLRGVIRLAALVGWMWSRQLNVLSQFVIAV